MNDTLHPWALFVDDRPPAQTALVPLDEAPRAAPSARIELTATDEERASYLVFGAVLCAVALVIGALVMGEVDSAAVAGAWFLAAAGAAAAGVWAAWTRVTRRAAVYTLDGRGIARHLPRPGRPDEVVLIPWDEVTFYRDSESTDHASLLAVGHYGARIRLHEADASEATYQFIRDFVAYAEHRSPLQWASPLQAAANRLGIAGTGVAMVLAMIVLDQIPEVGRGVATAVAVSIIFLIHSYTVLTDEDRAREDRRSEVWDARARDAIRRLLRIESI